MGSQCKVYAHCLWLLRALILAYALSTMYLVTTWYGPPFTIHCSIEKDYLRMIPHSLEDFPFGGLSDLHIHASEGGLTCTSSHGELSTYLCLIWLNNFSRGAHLRVQLLLLFGTIWDIWLGLPSNKGVHAHKYKNKDPS